MAPFPGHPVAGTLGLVFREIQPLSFPAPLKPSQEHFAQRWRYTKLGFLFKMHVWLCLKAILSAMIFTPPLLQNFLEILSCITKMMQIRKRPIQPFPPCPFMLAAVLFGNCCCMQRGRWVSGRQAPPNCVGKSVLSNTCRFCNEEEGRVRP